MDCVFCGQKTREEEEEEKKKKEKFVRERQDIVSGESPQERKNTNREETTP